MSGGRPRCLAGLSIVSVRRRAPCPPGHRQYHRVIAGSPYSCCHVSAAFHSIDTGTRLTEVNDEHYRRRATGKPPLRKDARSQARTTSSPQDSRCDLHGSSSFKPSSNPGIAACRYRRHTYRRPRGNRRCSAGQVCVSRVGILGSPTWALTGDLRISGAKTNCRVDAQPVLA